MTPLKTSVSAQPKSALPSLTALHGIKVLDLSRVFAGPFCAQTLADLGADVLKVEPPGGDDARSWPPLASGVGTIFLANNRSKRSIVIDLKRPEGREVLLELIAGADVLVENFTPGVTDRLGIGFDVLSELNPRLVLCSITAFGSSGPWRNARGYDNVLQAFSGMMALTGEAEGGPVRSVFSPVDQAAAQHAVTGILAALLERERSGLGRHVQVSLLESAMTLMSWNFQIRWATGRDPERSAAGNRQRVPYEVFDAANGRKILIAVGNDAIWQRFCEALGHDEWLEDERYATNSGRALHYRQLIGEINAATATLDAAMLAERLVAAGVPASAVQNLQEALDHPQTLACDLIQAFDRSEGTEQASESTNFRCVALPLRFNGVRPPVISPPPELGQHTVEVLKEAGYHESSIERLVATGAIR